MSAGRGQSENSICKRLRVFLRRIVANVFENAPFVLACEEFVVANRFFRRINIIDGTVNDDCRNRDFRKL